MSLLRYKTAPICSLSGPLRHSGAGRKSGVARPVRSYNPVFTYPCQPPPPAPVRSFPFPGIAGCTPPAVFVCAWGSALPPAGAAAVFPGSPGAGPPSQPPVPPRARLPGFPGVRSGRLFQPLSRSNRPFETFRGRKMALRGSRGRPGASGAEALPLPQAGSASGSSCGRGLPAGRPPFGSQRPEGPFSASRRIPRGAGGLKARTGASWGRPGPFSPLRPGLLSGPWPIFGSQKPAGPFSAPGRCWKRWKRSCGLKARTGASWGRPGPSPGRSLFPLSPCLSPEPFPPSLFFNPLYVDSRRRGERERERERERDGDLYR